MTTDPSLTPAVAQATAAVGRRLLVLDRLLAHLDATAARLRVAGDDERLHEIVDNETSALRWALRIVRPHVDTEIAATVEREARRKKWGVYTTCPQRSRSTRTTPARSPISAAYGRS